NPKPLLRAREPRLKAPPELNGTDAYRWRYHNDGEFRIMEIMRRRLRKVALRGRGYSGNNLAWLGCTPEQFRSHLEVQFKEGMNWDNLGRGMGCWHIDHIRPCASFDLTQESEVLACFHYTNIQPLWSHENIAKSSIWNGVRY